MPSYLSRDDECHHERLKSKIELYRDSHCQSYGISRLVVDRFSCEPTEKCKNLAKNERGVGIELLSLGRNSC